MQAWAYLATRPLCHPAGRENKRLIRKVTPVVTLLTVPAAVSASISEASSVDDLRTITTAIKAGYSGPTTAQGIALSAAGLFESGVRLLEIIAETGRLHKALSNAILTALDKDVQSAGLAAVKAEGGDTRRLRFGQAGHAWREISDAQLGTSFLIVRQEIDRLLAGASGNTAVKAAAISKAIKEELFSIWSVDNRIVLGDDFGDDEFDVAD